MAQVRVRILGILTFRYPAHPGPIGCWAGSMNLLVAAVRVRILEIIACDIQPLPNRSFSARPPILARGHHSEDFRSEGHGLSKSCREILNLRCLIVGRGRGISLRLGCGCEFWESNLSVPSSSWFDRVLGGIQESGCGCSAGMNFGNNGLRYPATSQLFLMRSPTLAA